MFLLEKGILQMLWKCRKVKGTVGLRQRHLHVPLQLHRRVCHNGSWTTEELIGIPEKYHSH